VIPEATKNKISVIGSGVRAHAALKDALGQDCRIPAFKTRPNNPSPPIKPVSVLQCVVEYIADRKAIPGDGGGVRRTHTVLAWPPLEGSSLVRRATFIRVDTVPVAHSSAFVNRTLSSATAYHDCDDGADDRAREIMDERDVWYATRALSWSAEEPIEAKTEAVPQRRLCCTCCQDAAADIS